MAMERWNTHFSTSVEVELLGVTLRLAQDPSSENLGTTVWDASIVMAKFLEKNIRKGEFSRAKARGKRAIDLGSGMGLGGLAFAMIGADVVLTDIASVLPLLRRNYETNLSPAVLRAATGDAVHAEAAGRVRVAELDWSQPSHFTGGGEGGAGVVEPPYDYILAADCIYHEHLVRHLYRAMLALSTERTTILIANELRSESVQRAFMDLFSPSFTFKKIPSSKMADGYQHPAIHLNILKRRKDASLANLEALEAEEAKAAAGDGAAAGSGSAEASGSSNSSSGGGGGANEAAGASAREGDTAAAGADTKQPAGASNAAGAGSSTGAGPGGDACSSGTSGGDAARATANPAKPSKEDPGAATAMALAAQMAASLGVTAPPSFDDRRAGSMAARLLSDVKVPPKGPM